MHEHKLFEDARAPNVNGLGAALDEELAIEPALSSKSQRRLLLLQILQVDVALEVVLVECRHVVDVRALTLVRKILASESVDVNRLVSIISLEELLHTFLTVPDLCDLGSLR